MMETVTERLEKFLIEQNEQGTKSHKPLANHEFYASSAGACPRYLYFSKKFGAPKFTTDTLKIFLVGNLVHDFIQEKIFKSGTSEQSLIYEEGPVIVRGRLDHLDGDVIFEFKSIKDVQYVIDKPKVENVYQLMIYLKKLNLTSGRLVYIEKNTFKIVEHIVMFNEDILKDAMKSFHIAYQALEADICPNGIIDDNTQNWKCRFCDRKDDCAKL